jgi:predicted exporter
VGQGDGRSKLGGAQRSRLKLMAQLQAHVPDPLTDDLPGFLSSGCMTAPAVRVLFVIFIGKQRGTRATMQVECHDIGGGEPILREMGEKEFVDHALAGVTDAAFFLRRQSFLDELLCKRCKVVFRRLAETMLHAPCLMTVV